MTRKLLTALVLMLIGVGQVQSQTVTLTETYFPDFIFRKYISSVTGVAEGGTLSEEKLKSVKTIGVGSKGITSLKGVEYFTALKELYCSRNLLSSLDVSHNTALTYLDCGDNQLTSLDVSQNTALTYLDCKNNGLMSLDVSHNTALTVLDCEYNNLKSLDVSSCLSLTGLVCSYNPLPSLDVSHNTALDCLRCNENQLTSLDVSHNTALIVLECYNNQLPSLDVSQNTALTRLECYSNQLTSLDVSHNTELTTLFCECNQLTSLDVSRNTALHSLHCSSNQLMCLDLSNNSMIIDFIFGPCPQSKSVVVYSLGQDQYSIDVPADFISWKVSSFNVNSESVTPDMVEGRLQFTSSSVPTTISYEYESKYDCYLKVTLTITTLEEPSEVELNATNFPDANFRAFITNLTGVAEGGMLSVEKQKSVKNIDVGGSSSIQGSISSLKGIEYFTNLMTLNCGNNKLSSLNLSKNTLLTEMYCENNQLMCLNLSKCMRLTSTNVGSQSKSEVAYLMTSNQYYFDVPVDFDLAKVSSFKVNSISVTPTLSNGKLRFTSSSVPTSVSYEYNTDNGVVGKMGVTVNITSIEDVSWNVLNTRTFPDAIFRAYITELTGIAEGDFLVEEKLRSVKTIDVSGSYDSRGNITSLKGVEYFPELTTLKCEYNQLSSLDVSQNTALTRLECYSNQLTSLDVSHNTALTELWCGSNQLTSLDVSHNTALTDLSCSGNKLSTLDVSHNTALTSLSCGGNKLSTLDVSHNSALTTMYCGDNQLTSLDVSQNTALTDLRCRGNQLSTLDVSHNTALTELWCGNNQLTSLDVSHNTELETLYCSYNQLTSLDVSQNTALKYLDCDSNQLMNLDLSKCTKLSAASVSSQSKSVVASSWGSNQYSIDVPADFNLSKVTSFTVNSVRVTPTLSEGKLRFTSSTVPSSVSYQYNTDDSAAGNMSVTVTITNIEDESGVVLNAANFPDDTFRAYISNLTGVAEGGRLSEEMLTSVTSIDVRGSSSANSTITNLKGVEYFTALKTLACSYNKLTSLDVSQNTALTRLYCAYTPMMSLDVSHNTALTELYCEYNQLSSLDVSHNTALTRLDCYLNQLPSLDVSHNTALTHLSCDNNQLPSLDVSHNTALTYLSCDNNQLTSLDVSGATALTGLSCEYNQLSSLDVSHNTALTELDCSYNQLTSLDVSHNTALKYLSCENNQLPSLDVSHNTALKDLSCSSNQLTSLDVSHNTALTYLKCGSNQLMSLDLSKCTKLESGYTSVSSQSKTVVASSWGLNQYSIDVPADFNLSKVTSFKVNSVSVTPTLSNGKLLFITSSIPTSVSYEYNTDNSVAGSMSVTVDITAVEDAVPANTVYMDDMEVMTGMEETLSVKMKNEVPMEGFEFDLYVPEGVTVATDGDGFPEVYLSTERTTTRKTNSFDAIFLPDGGVRVLAASTNGSAISGNDGEIVTVKVNIGADMAEGDYTVLLKNIALSGTDAVSHPTEQMSSTLHVTYGILGDANRDKRVDVADFTTTAHHILGKNPDPFNDKAANANRDERIDVGDLTAIAHIILYGSMDKPTNGANGLPRRAPATDSGEQGGEGYPTNYVYIDPVSAESGTEQTLSVKMKNAVDAEGFEFDLYLPEGMSFVLDADGFPEATLSTERTTTRKTNSFDAVIQPDGALRVLAASTNGSVISGHDGEVALVKVRIDGDVPTGTYLLTLKEIAVSDVDCVSHRTDELVSDITVESGSPTSLGGVVTDGDDDNTYYNMSGQRINKPTRSGVYIQRGKKVVVK